MPYLGRYRLGDDVPLTLQCVDASGTASVPTEAPYADVWNASAKIMTLRLPVADKFQATGLFHQLLRLGIDFATGHYRVVYRYLVGSFVGQEVDVFQIVAGGDVGGPVLAMHAYDRADATFIVHQLSSGRLVKGRNPKL